MSDTDRGKTIKLTIAGVAGVLAVVVILYNLGIIDFSSPPKPPPPITEGMTDAEKKEFEKQQAEREKLDKIRAPSGA